MPLARSARFGLASRERAEAREPCLALEILD